MWNGSECEVFEVQQFESAQLSRGSGRRGQKGGHWSACTHLGMFKMFGLNTAPLLMRFLASLQPQEALEIGCGLGTTADYLARFSSGGSQVSCVEPEPMLAEVFAQRAFPMRAAQLSVDLFAQEDTRPEACFNALLTRRFPLVYSFEVAEHIPPHRLPRLIRLVAAATSRLLVFSAARPGQRGTGHYSGSLLSKRQWIDKFTRAGLVLLPKLSAFVSQVAFPERAADISPNVFVMRAQMAADINEEAEVTRAHQLLRRQAFDPAINMTPPVWSSRHARPVTDWFKRQTAARPLQRTFEADHWPALVEVGKHVRC